MSFRVLLVPPPLMTMEYHRSRQSAGESGHCAEFLREDVVVDAAIDFPPAPVVRFVIRAGHDSFAGDFEVSLTGLPEWTVIKSRVVRGAKSKRQKARVQWVSRNDSSSAPCGNVKDEGHLVVERERFL